MRPGRLESLDKNSQQKIIYSEFAEQILYGKNLSDKLYQAEIEWTSWNEFRLPDTPGRSSKIEFSENQVKFPKTNQLHEIEKKALALHCFANHELLAIEMMACAILLYPHQTEEDIKFKKGLLSSLIDEQNHFSLYLRRLNELGYDFGDFPRSDFFWKQMPKLKTPAEFLAVMSLTFESANLDFAQYYAEIFRQIGDEKTASILDMVLADEIKHVAFGANWMKKWKKDKDLWSYYQSSLPWPMTPARSKGIHFDSKLHLRAVNDNQFIHSLEIYDDEFKITKRHT